jgi:hypothetical protein
VIVRIRASEGASATQRTVVIVVIVIVVVVALRPSQFALHERSAGRAHARDEAAGGAPSRSPRVASVPA